MAEENGDRIEALFHQAADLPPDERQALLDRECTNDPQLRAALVRLLADDARLHSQVNMPFLESPIIRSDADTETADSADEPRLPSHLGRYRLIRLIGQGGMGTVYEAEQDLPRRTVALKVLRAGLASPSLLKRFRHESQILGRLHHPGIAQVYEAGLADDGLPFFAMEFIRGLPLDEYARLKAKTLRARVELLARVCDAVQHAHDQGVIHRDLKPTNILVEENGQPKVLDFGVARATEADLLTEAALTQTGQLLGTPNYMSPEQVSGDPAAIDRRADVYALGVILFELVAHRLPFRLENRLLPETVRLILEEDAPRLGSIDPSLRGDIETIVAKALEKDRARRYSSAADLAADLRRWLADEPILARPPSALYNLRKFARRNRAVVRGVLATFAALILGFVGMAILAFAEARQRDLAEKNAKQAEQNAEAANDEKREALAQAYLASLAAANASLQNHDVGDAARLLKLAPEALRSWEWQHLQSRLDDSSAVIAVPANPGGFVFAGADQLHIGVFTNTGLRISDLDGTEQRTVPIRPQYRRDLSVAQTQRGLRIAAWIDDVDFDLLDDTGQVLCRMTLPGNKRNKPTPVVISPDGTRLACGREAQPEFSIFDATNGKQTAECSVYGNGIKAFSPDSSWLATGAERSVRVWDVANGTLLTTCQGHAEAVQSVAFSPDGARLVTTSRDGTVRQWDSRTGQEVEQPYDRHRAIMYSAVYSPDGQWVASAGADRAIRVWRARGRRDVAVLQGHMGYVLDVVFTPDGRRLVSRGSRMEAIGWDNTLRVWDLDPRATLPVLRGHTSFVYPVAYSPDGRWLASGSWDKTVRLWDAATGELSATLPHPDFVEGLAFGPDGTWLVTVCHGDRRLRLWDLATARVRKEIPLNVWAYPALTVSPDGTRVATRDYSWDTNNWHLSVLDIGSKQSLFTAEGSALAYSPDGRWLAATAADAKTLLLLDAKTHETIARFRGHESEVFKAVFSRDSSYLASCSQDRTVRLWQIGTGACRVLKGHSDVVYGVAFHPNGTRLASGARDGVICLWDVARGEEVVRLRGHEDYVWSLAFSPDGSTLASGSGDGTVRLWDTSPLRTRYQARREAADLKPKAERWVERLWREKKGTADIVEAIRSDRLQSEALRHAALRAVLRQAQAPEAGTDSPQALPKQVFESNPSAAITVPSGSEKETGKK
jgi:WD40 repeat protein/predicted Ser/Thr protein kinase